MDAKDKSPGDIAVIGIGCMFPNAEHLTEYWANIVKGRDAIGPIPLSHWRPEDYYKQDPKHPDHTYAQTGGFLKPYAFDPLQFGIAPHAIEATDTAQLLGMVCAHEALIDAGYGPDRSFDRERTACILGVTGTLELVIPLGARLGHPIWKQALQKAGISEELSRQVMDDIADAYVPWQENSFPGLLGNVVAGRIASRLDLGGSNAVVDAACASSLAALHMALMELESGRSDMVITGGVDTFNDIFMYMCFSKTPALSPTGHARPFDGEGDGTILGEGIGTVILKRREQAERDGDRIYALIRGIGSSSDGKGQAIYAPSAKGQVKALRRAYERADVNPESIELLEAHGTGTKVGDGVELDALAQVYPQNAPAHCVIGSVKSQIGHTKAAAGAAGLIKAVMALYHKVQPPTLKVRRAHKNMSASPFEILDKARPWVGRFPRRAALSAFGFGGSNYHCVLEEYPGTPKPMHWDDSVQFGVWSAGDRGALVEALERSLADLLEGVNPVHLGRRLRMLFRSQDAERAAIWADGSDSFKQRLRQAIDKLKTGHEAPLPGFAHAQGHSVGKLAFIYAGQGSQTPGMLRELALNFPEALETLEMASSVLQRHEGSSPYLTQIMYPGQAFDDATKATQDAALRTTRRAQLALGAMAASATKILERFGLRPQMTAGHSYGELPALYAAGALRLDELLAASYQRGKLMAEHGRAGGGMLAVMESPERVQALLAEAGVDLSLANYNSPAQVVVAGDMDAVRAFAVHLQSRGIGAQILNVDTAFHTPYVQGATAAFARWLDDEVVAQHPVLPVYGNASGESYGSTSLTENLSEQLGKPVLFAQMLANMQRDGAEVFVEIGPGRKLQGLLRASTENARVLALDAESGSSLLGLAALLAQLAVLGFSVDLPAWHPGPLDEPPASKRFTVPISGANYRAPRPPKPAQLKAEVPQAPELEKIPEPPAARPETPIVSELIPQTPAVASASEHAAPKHEEDDMTRNWTQIEDLLRDMQEVQKKTADAHTLFLENQRQFQDLLRQALTGESAVASVPESRPVAKAPMAQAPVPPPTATAPMRKPEPQPSRSVAPAPVPAAPVPIPLAPVLAQSPAKAASEAAESPSDSYSQIARIVADATGFPSEMLKPEMHLEADLGIDSIKKVEIFSQLQTQFPHVEADASRMNDVQTLADMARYAALPETPEPPVDEDRQGAWSASQVAFAARIEPSLSQVQEKILKCISEKTGFPADMLQADMDLEADLGVDSIKKVEIFSALQEQFPDAQLAADALHSLRKIDDLVRVCSQMSPASSSDAAAPLPAIPVEQLSPIDSQRLQHTLWAVISEKTGYPAEVLEAGMDLESDLGIDSIKRVEILSALGEKFPSLPSPDPSLRTLGDLLQLIGYEEKAESLLYPEAVDLDLSVKKKADATVLPPLNEEEEKQPADCWKLTSVPWTPGTGGFVLPQKADVWIVDDGSNLCRNLMVKLQERGHSVKLISLAMSDRLTIPARIDALFLLAPLQFEHLPLRWLQNAFRLIKKLGPALLGHPSAVVSISRHGGHFGLDGLQQLSQVYAGSVSAFTKTIRHEWEGVHTRALDMGRDFADGFEAALRCLEASFIAGPLELGVMRDRYFTLRLEEENQYRQNPQKALSPDGVVLVTGGARGVTAATVRSLARRYPARYIIWGRTPLEAQEAPETRDSDDPLDLKRILLQNNPSLKHPKDLEQAYRQLLSQRELRRNLEQLKRLGSEVVYEAVDVSSDPELREGFQRLKNQGIGIEGVIHGAGVIRDHLLLDQSEDELAEVLETKLRILPYLERLAQAGTRWMIFFSSSTARLGRKGQGAYALANEALNRMASYLPNQYPCRVLSLNWGPWDGGMVHDGLKKLFASEGLATIDLESGAELQTYLLEHEEIASGEWLILGAGGRELLGDQLLRSERILQEWSVQLENLPILMDHVIKHRAVVPAALLLEWMMGAVKTQYPDFQLAEAHNFHVWKGIILDPGVSIDLEIVVPRESVLSSSEVDVECILRSRSKDGKLRPHAHVFVRLSLDEGKTNAQEQPEFTSDSALAELDPYAELLFHGENLQLIERVLVSDAERFTALVRARGEPQQWAQQLAGKPWVSHAPLIDSVFQGLIVWSGLERKTRCLPTRLEKLNVLRPWSEGSLTLDMRIVQATGHKLRADAEIWDADGRLVLQIIGAEATMDAALVESFGQRELRQDPLASPDHVNS